MSLLKRLFSFDKKTSQNEGLAAFDAAVVAYGREDYIAAYQLFSKLANEGHAVSQMYLGIMYQKGQGATKDYKKSFNWMSKAAKQGQLQAQYSLAVMYEHGEGTQQEQGEAVHWYRKSAEQGSAYAQYSLASMLDKGIGIEKNPKEAAKYLHLAAEQGHIEAQHNLALKYSDGNGVKQNHAEAARWYKQSAEQGHIYSQFNLGICYRDGRGVEKDNQEAVRWWRKAAEQGLKEAQYSLGAFFDTGKGVEQNYNEAAHWYRKAAVQGNSTAQLYLGAMYKKGEGVPLDLKEAYAWFSVSSTNGCEDATEQLDSLAYNMPNAQLELGKSLAKEYIKKYQTSSHRNKSNKNSNKAQHGETTLSANSAEGNEAPSDAKEKTFQSALNIYVDGEMVTIFNIKGIGPGRFTGRRYNKGIDAGDYNFTVNDVTVPELHKIDICKDINRHAFFLLYFATHTTQEGFIHNTERLHTAILVKGDDFSLVNHLEPLGTQDLCGDIINKIRSNSIDYGVFFYFTNHPESKAEGICIEIIHPLFSVIYFIPIQYQHDESKEYHDLLLSIHCDKITKLNTGDAVAEKIKTSFVYLDARGVQTTRELLGAESYVIDDKEYIRGFCLLRYQERHFRRDRILKFI